MREPGFLFIGGCARSGTSPLWQVVTADPSVAVGLERYGRFVQRPKQFTPELFTRERFLDIREDDTFYDSFDYFPHTQYNEIVDRFDTARWHGDKIPRLHPLYSQIADAFPNPKILYIVRNPFDVAASFQRRALNPEDRTWTPTRDYRAACAEWNASLLATNHWRDRLSIYVVDYESFFAGQANIAGLAEFLELEPDSLQAGYERQVRVKRPNKPDVLGGYGRQYVSRTANLGAYRKLLEAADHTRLAGWPPARATPRGTKKYADQDERIVDYEYYEAVPGRWFRGPPPDPAGGPPIAFLGAASTFGRFVERPYASLVASEVDAQPLNLGYGGARAPSYYTDRRLLDLINASRCAVIECFSARGTGTPGIETRDHISAFLRPRGSKSDFAFADAFFASLLKMSNPRDLHRVRDEIRAAYIDEMGQLLRLVEVPKILLWFSQRPPEERTAFADLGEYMGVFPHFVTEGVVEALIDQVDEVVRVFTDVGIPNSLTDRDDGSAVPIFRSASDPARNAYYPSPLMHEAAAEALAGPVGRLSGASADHQEALNSPG